MKKCITAVLAALALTVCAIPLKDESNTFQTSLSVKAKDKAMSGTCGDNLTWALDDEGTLTISGRGDMESYKTSNNYNPFSYRKDITSIIINEGVTSIGDKAFNGCSNLISIIIPNSVTFLGESVFNGCTNLTDITIPKGLTSISSQTFNGCSSLDSIILPDSVTTIGYGAFSGCENLTSITIPESMTSVDLSAFENCSGLEAVFYTGTEEQWNEIPESVKSNPIFWQQKREQFLQLKTVA